MEEQVYIIEYRYNENCHMRYRLFDNFKDCNDYYSFLSNNLTLSHLCVKLCRVTCEVLLCGN